MLIMFHISVRWTLEAKFRSPADIFSPFGKGGSRGICLSGGEVFVTAPHPLPHEDVVERELNFVSYCSYLLDDQYSVWRER